MFSALKNPLALFFLVGLFSLNGNALNLSEEASSYYQGIFNDPKIKKNAYVSTLGIGNQINSLNVNGSESLWTTNRNFLNLAFKVNDSLSLRTAIQFKDPKQSRDSRIDSEVQTMELI